jgi:hypothetical protein
MLKSHRQVAALPATLEGICDEMKDVMNFKPFVMFGGPNPSGTGGIQIFQYVSRQVFMSDISHHRLQCRRWRNSPDRPDVSPVSGSAVGNIEE